MFFRLFYMLLEKSNSITPEAGKHGSEFVEDVVQGRFVGQVATGGSGFLACLHVIPPLHRWRHTWIYQHVHTVGRGYPPKRGRLNASRGYTNLF